MHHLIWFYVVLGVNPGKYSANWATSLALQNTFSIGELYFSQSCFIMFSLKNTQWLPGASGIDFNFPNYCPQKPVWLVTYFIPHDVFMPSSLSRPHPIYRSPTGLPISTSLTAWCPGHLVKARPWRASKGVWGFSSLRSGASSRNLLNSHSSVYMQERGYK